MTFEEAVWIMIAFFLQGFGIEFSKWVFEKVRKLENRVKINGKH